MGGGGERERETERERDREREREKETKSIIVTNLPIYSVVKNKRRCESAVHSVCFGSNMPLRLSIL